MGESGVLYNIQDSQSLSALLRGRLINLGLSWPVNTDSLRGPGSFIFNLNPYFREDTESRCVRQSWLCEDLVDLGLSETPMTIIKTLVCSNKGIS